MENLFLIGGLTFKYLLGYYRVYIEDALMWTGFNWLGLTPSGGML
jgi:hypothetical protein